MFLNISNCFAHIEICLTFALDNLKQSFKPEVFYRIGHVKEEVISIEVTFFLFIP